MANKVVCV